MTFTLVWTTPLGVVRVTYSIFVCDCRIRVDYSTRWCTFFPLHFGFNDGRIHCGLLRWMLDRPLLVRVCLSLGGTISSHLEARFSPHFVVEEP